MEKRKVTIYYTSSMGGFPNRLEGYLVEHSLTDYAQYKQVPQITFIPKGKRNSIRFIKGYKPFYLILEGWNTPQLDENQAFNISENNGFKVMESKYLSYDERYIYDFNRFINPLLEKEIIIADYRYTKEQEEILFNAIQDKDNASINRLTEKANNGETIRIT